ncbi:MAG: hypothetical protein H6823_19935 [Planctomycetaceae bacterium]|nr:hypothetical protein [Planctomycetaceae bacterium]
MISRNVPGRRITIVTALLCLVSLCGGRNSRLLAQESGPSILQFQRITIPDGRIDEIGGELLPLDRETFQKTIAELNAKYRALYGLAKPKIVRAFYSAKFENRQLVGGLANLEIKHPHRESVYLSLSPFGLAANSFRWKSDPNTATQVGLLPTGDIGVFVSASDTLSFQWSLRGVVGSELEQQFRLTLPEATASELLLNLPTGARPECIDAIISEVNDTPPPRRDAVQTTQWRIELGATHETELRILLPPENVNRDRLVMARPTFDYRISSTGVEIRAGFLLDLQRQAIRELTMQVDPRLRIASIQLDSKPIGFAPVPDESESAQRYLLELPASIADGPNELSVTAHAPVDIDKLWQLPQLQLVDVLWRQGTASIDVVEPLRVGQLNWEGTVLRGVEPLPAPATGESRRFALLNSDASCNLLLTRQAPRLHAQIGTTITLNDSIVAAECIAQLSANGGAVFSIPLQRDAGWIVDSIESVPPLIDHIDTVRGTLRLSREIVLRDPITPEKPLRLIVKAHRRMPDAGVLTGLEMRPISLVDEASRSRLTVVRAELPLQLDVLGDASVSRLTEAELSTVEKGLVSAEAAPLLFRDDPMADRVRVALRTQTPRFRGEVTAEALVDASTIKQSFLFQCSPISTQISSLRVRFSPPPSDPIQWTSVGDGAGGVTAIKLDVDGNEWEVRLRRPRSVPFEIRAKLTHKSIPADASSFAIPESIVLASLPDADTQVGTISLGTPDGTGFSLQQDGLRAIPTPVSDIARLQTSRAMYRYAPAQDVALQLTRHTAQNDPPDAWIWDANVTSHIDADGEITHVMLLRIENVGASQLTVELPQDAMLDGVDVDGEQVVTSQDATTLSVPLPALRRFPCVRLRYRQSGRPLGNYRREILSLPVFKLRVLHRSWQVWVPPGYESTTGNTFWDLASSYATSTEALRWEQRLFGYSILRRTGTPWNFASLFGQSREVTGQANQSQMLSRLQTFFDSFDAIIEKEQDSSPLTWDAAIANANATVAESVPPLPFYVDLESLADLGISPISLVSSRATSTLNALRLSDLVLVVSDNALLLTTFAAQASGDFGSCTEINERTFSTPVSWLDGQTRYLPVDEWSGHAGLSPQLWHDADTDRTFTPLFGWTCKRLPPESLHTTIILCRTEMLDTLGWAAFFAAIACGLWVGRRRGAFLICFVIVAMVVALLVPVGLVYLSRSVLLGLLAAIALIGLRRRSSKQPALRQSDDSMSYRIARRAESVTAGLLLVAVIFAITSSRRVSAQEQPPMGIRAVANVFRVYDPVDSEGKPSGAHMYVSRAFFESIESLKMTLGTQRFGVVLTEARYSLAVPDMPMAAMLPELVVEFDVTSPSIGPTVIRLPFDRDELQVIEATIDGQRIYPQWSPDGELLEMDAEILNRHKLRLIVRPVLTPRSDQTSFDMRIPAIPSSRLSITGRDVASIEPTLALGAISRSDDSIEAELGPANRLSVQWPVTDTRNPSPAEFTVSQLTWVRAESRVVTIETQFAFSVISGSLTEVELLVDPRLHLLAADTQAQVVDSLTPDTALRRIRYQFKTPYKAGESVTIKPSFVITDIAQDEIVTRPLIQLASQIIDNSLLALSTSPGIAASVIHEGDWPSVQPQMFAEAWGTMQLPKAAMQLPTNESEWSLAIAPLKPRLSNAGTTELRIRRQQADIRYVDQLRVDDAPVLHFVLRLPSQMAIENARVLQDDIDLLHRYSKSPDGTTTIYLTSPTQGKLRVEVQGSLPLPPRGEFTWEGIRLTDSATSSHRLEVFRHADVLVRVVSIGSSEVAESPPSDQRHDADVRRVGVYDLTEEIDAVKSEFKFDISPNAARFSGQLVTTLHSEESQWSVVGDLRLQVAQGVLDSVRVRLPRELVSSLSLDPPLPYKVLEVPGQSEPNLVIAPPTAIDKVFRVRLNALLQTSPDGSISAPPIEILDSPQIERLLVLPKRSAEQEIEWDIRGLEQPESDELQTTYRVRGRRMRAVVREVNQSAGNPRLLLTDIEVTWQSDASYVGIASFDLEPGALTTCDLVIPPGVDLLHVTVDDVPALLQHTDTEIASFMLGSDRLPQRITALFTGQALSMATEPNSLTFAAPSLRDLESEATLWAIRDPVSEASVPMLNHTMIDEAATRKIRVDVLQEVLGYSVGPVPQHRSNDLQIWERRWRERLKKVGAVTLEENSPRRASVISMRDTSALPHAAQVRDDWTYCSFDGATQSLTIIRHDRDKDDFAKRLAIAMTMCIGTWFAFKVTSRDSIRDAVSRWPYLPGVVLGLAWWLWLAPSVVGWLIVAVFLAGSIRPIWRSRAVR